MLWQWRNDLSIQKAKENIHFEQTIHLRCPVDGWTNSLKNWGKLMEERKYVNDMKEKEGRNSKEKDA